MTSHRSNLVFGLTSFTSTLPTEKGFNLPRCGVHVSGRARLALRSNAGRLAAASTAQDMQDAPADEAYYSFIDPVRMKG